MLSSSKPETEMSPKYQVQCNALLQTEVSTTADGGKTPASSEKMKAA